MGKKKKNWKKFLGVWVPLIRNNWFGFLDPGLGGFAPPFKDGGFFVMFEKGFKKRKTEKKEGQKKNFLFQILK